MSDVASRARMHAALGDVARLGIVDRLCVADVSPGELAEAFDMPTNLLAHHLRVLEGAGIVRRVRSEGDRRRAYLQLRLDDPTVVALVMRPTALSLSAARVVFVCTRNSARSQLAAAIWRQVSAVPAASAGTRSAEKVHRCALAVGRRHGLRLGRARTSHVDDILQVGDLVVAVCDNAHEELPPMIQRIHWAVPDPVRADTEEAFDAAYTELSQRIDRLAAAVPAPHDQDD